MSVKEIKRIETIECVSPSTSNVICEVFCLSSDGIMKTFVCCCLREGMLQLQQCCLAPRSLPAGDAFRQCCLSWPVLWSPCRLTCRFWKGFEFRPSWHLNTAGVLFLQNWFMGTSTLKQTCSAPFKRSRLWETRQKCFFLYEGRSRVYTVI